jgi:hypothetical protein
MASSWKLHILVDHELDQCLVTVIEPDALYLADLDPRDLDSGTPP